ncbi:MAG: endonuclease III domain-containing protein [Candidatus Latescibacteria bacterium]|nr:endonuclease III domain-containing protein [Candidatus Latescibacterota bacterium]
MSDHPPGFQRAYATLLAAFGPQGWWPADSPFEVMVGAILTQNTAWTNVERAIERLKESGRFTPVGLLEIPDSEMAGMIRSSGYFRLKTRRLKAFLDTFVGCYGGDVGRMRARPLALLRSQLLGIHGVGPETADCILLYALDKPSFVVDAYTRRAFGRLGLVDAGADYHDIQARFTEHLSPEVGIYQEYHALIVALGKDICRPKPRCDRCPLAAGCPASSANQEDEAGARLS